MPARPDDRGPNQRGAVAVRVILACLLLSGCSMWTVKTDPLVVASCPTLTPLADATFGATTLKLIEVAGQYHQCRCAAMPKECAK